MKEDLLLVYLMVSIGPLGKQSPDWEYVKYHLEVYSGVCSQLGIDSS